MREQIINAFSSEFGVLASKFEIVDISIGAPSNKEIHEPGVYVFYHNEDVWKVGKSNVNAYWRSQQHFQDDTGSNIGFGMKQYAQDENMKLLLFLVAKENIHWTYALEYFLETHFESEKKLKIKSKRR